MTKEQIESRAKKYADEFYKIVDGSNPQKVKRWNKGYNAAYCGYKQGLIDFLKTHKSQLKPQERKGDNFYQKTLKRTPIKTRLNALFQMEWLIMNTSKQPTAKEMVKAMDWAHELSEQVIEDFKTWEKNKKPPLKQ